MSCSCYSSYSSSSSGIFFIYRTFSHSLCTSASDNCLQAIRFSIQPSSVGIEGGSRGADVGCASGILTSSMFVSMFGSIDQAKGFELEG